MEEAAVSLATREGLFAVLFLIAYTYNIYDTRKREDDYKDIIKGLQGTISVLTEENLSGIVSITKKADEVVRCSKVIEQEIYKLNLLLNKGGYD